MLLIGTHRHLVYRLLPQRWSNWRRLEGRLKAQRQLYNAVLKERIDGYREIGKSFPYFDQSLTACRATLPDMAAVSVALQRGTLKRHAFKGFFRRVKAGAAARAGGDKAGFPRFQGRRRCDSLTVVSGVKLRTGRLPGLDPLVICRGSPYSEGKLVSAVLKRRAGKWVAVICFKVTLEAPTDNGEVLSLEMNTGQVADSVFYQAPDLRRLEARKGPYQRQLARQSSGGRTRLAKTAQRITTKQHNWHHQVSRRLADETLVIEALPAKAMTRSVKGTLQAPGQHVRATAGRNRVMHDTGWAALRQLLDYKAGQVILVPARYTSLTCHVWVDAASRKTQALCRCTTCGHAAHADIHAPQNIRGRGLKALTRSGIGTAAWRGALAQATPMSREINAEANWLWPSRV